MFLLKLWFLFKIYNIALNVGIPMFVNMFWYIIYDKIDNYKCHNVGMPMFSKNI